MMHWPSNQFVGPVRYSRMMAASVLTAAMFVAAASPVAAQKVRVVNFAKSGNWNVQAIYDRARQVFSHCSASATYRSGTKVSLIAYAGGDWKLQFYKRDWPKRPVTKFPARLVVDGKVVLRGAGNFRGRSAFIALGRSSKRVIALMRGRVMSIRTPSGTSSFRLDGTFRATVQLARCWKVHTNRPPSSGAFASNQGAFGSAPQQGGAFGATPRSSRGAVLPRGRTLELATAYLSKSKRPYSFLTRDKNVLKHFPVNWKFENGVIGGMKVYRNSGTGAEAVLQRMLAQQAANCKGRSATDRESVLRLKNGRRVYRARGVCEAKASSIIDIRYRVMELNAGMVMVVMHMGLKGVDSDRSGTPLSGGGRTEQRRLPGPNDL